MQREWMPTVAGTLDLVAGAFSLLGAMVLAILGLVFAFVPAEAFDNGDAPPAWVAVAMLAFALWLLVVGAVAIIGGIAVLRRRGGAWPLAGAIAAIVASGLLGVPALILTVLAESEARSPADSAIVAAEP